MNQDLFRKSAMDRVTSPDQLNDTIKVVPTGIWLVLVAIIVVVVATLVFLSTTDIQLTTLLVG